MRGGRGGRRKNLGNYRPQRKTAPPSSSSPPLSDKEEEDEEEKQTYSAEEEENKEREYDEEDEEEEELEEERPKLAEGYYEIEDIRKKRTHKGQVQYLIKWRGWPEGANTWEPIANLGSCSDLIDAFDEHRSSKSSKKGKRKHKQGNSHTPLKKRKLSTTASTLFATQPSSNGPCDSNPAEGIQVEMFPLQVADDILAEAGHADNSVGENQNKETNEANPQLDQEKIPDDLNVGNFSIQMPDAGISEKEDQPKDENQLTGAKRRKSGRVSRFKPDSEEALRPVTISPEPSHQSPAPEPSEKAASDDHNCLPTIVQIIKAMRFSTSVSGNVQNVSVTFKALRSDGQEVEVDNKFLRDNYHHLLINFYEQHLRCNCPA